MMAEVRHAAPVVTASAIEGLIRSVPHPPALLARLSELGITVGHLRREYPPEIFAQAVRAIGSTVFAELPPDEAERAVGRRFVSGFLQTVIGRVVTVTLPWLGPGRMMERVPRYVGLGQIGMLRCTVERLDARSYRTAVAQLAGDPVPHFMAGILEAALERTRTEAKVSVVGSSATGYELLASW